MKRGLSCAIALVAAGCGGEPITQGLTEPIRVLGAQFRSGPLPGDPPLTLEQLAEGAQLVRPYPTPPEVAGRIVNAGELDFPVNGRASADTYAVAFQIAGAGTGYWLVPVSAPDPSNNDELTWSATLDLGPALGPGLRRLRVAAVDAAGRSGTQRELELCVRSPVPDNLNGCDATLQPPALVVSLTWDDPADLDLSIIASDGTIVDRANTRGSGAGTAGAQLERDVHAGCLSAGAPRENVIWQTPPAPGVYSVYVNLYDGCGELSVPFTLSSHVSEEPADSPGQYRQIETFRSAGALTSFAANGGGQRGLWVTELEID
jgi:hypothetical protein